LTYFLSAVTYFLKIALPLREFVDFHVLIKNSKVKPFSAVCISKETKFVSDSNTEIP